MKVRPVFVDTALPIRSILSGVLLCLIFNSGSARALMVEIDAPEAMRPLLQQHFEA